MLPFCPQCPKPCCSSKPSAEVPQCANPRVSSFARRATSVLPSFHPLPLPMDLGSVFMTCSCGSSTCFSFLFPAWDAWPVASKQPEQEGSYPAVKVPKAFSGRARLCFPVQVSLQEGGGLPAMGDTARICCSGRGDLDLFDVCLHFASLGRWLGASRTLAAVLPLRALGWAGRDLLAAGVGNALCTHRRWFSSLQSFTWEDQHWIWSLSISFCSHLIVVSWTPPQ